MRSPRPGFSQKKPGAGYAPALDWGIMETPSKPANELEGLIRDKLPDPARRHLVDVIIDRTDIDGLGPNWTAQPVWSHEVSNNDKREFTSALFAVLRDYELLTDD